MARGAEALRPTHRGFPLRTAYLLPLPVYRELLERIGARDLHLPALTRPRRAPQGMSCSSRLWTSKSALI